MIRPASTTSSRRQALFWLWGAIFFVLGIYLWSALITIPSIASKEPQGFYGLLTDAFLHGQLHLRTEPDPRLFKLANPYAGAQDVPRLHDASFFNGHYYLYFGPTAVFVFFAPWKLLTGTFPNDGLGTAFFVAFGFLMAARLWWRLAQTHFPRLHPAWIAAGALILGLGNYILYVVQASSVYSVPIACAFACLMVALNAVEGSFSASTPSKKVIALGLASFAWGLAVASRPDYLFGLTGLALPAVFIWWQLGRAHGFNRWRTWSALFWSALPAGFIGATLAWYNFIRYGNPFEFGLTYQFTAGDSREVKITGLGNILPNLREYLFTKGNYSPYFPFVWTKGEPIGVLDWAPFAILAAAFPLILLSRRFRESSSRVVFGSTFFVVTIASVIALCYFAFTNTRYAIDFLIPTTWCALFSCAAILDTVQERSVFLRWSLGMIVGLAGASTCLHSLSLAIQQHPDSASFRVLSAIGDAPAALWEKLIPLPHGPVVMKMSFVPRTAGQREPLVSSAFGRDLLFIQHVDQNHVAFGYFHEGTGGPLSDPVPYEEGKIYTLECDLGSLYPPREHPLFYGWDVSLVDALRRHVEVKLDGRSVLHWTSTFYPAQPFETEYGKNRRGVATVKRFSGKLVSVSHPGMPARDQAAPVPGDGPLRLTLKFPSFGAMYGEPLVSTGRPGQGDLVYVRYLGTNRLRFGHDSWSNGNVETADITYDPSSEHTVDVDLGPLHAASSSAPAANPAEPSRFQLRFDGKLLISVNRSFHPSSPHDVSLGFNATGCSSAAGLFTGPYLRAERIADFSPRREADRQWGSLSLTLMLPLVHPALREPLLVTGKTGKGDFVYLIGVDDHHIRIGYDHWGIFGTMSDLIEIEPSHPHVFRISMAPLFPPSEDAAWQRLDPAAREKLRANLTVEIDEQKVLSLPAATYPAKRDEIYICENPIGGSTCGAVFTGKVYAQIRNDFSTAP